MKMRIIGLFFFVAMGNCNAMPLLGGRFETTTDVQGILSLALDIAAITKSNDVDARESIYLSGQNGYYTINTNNATEQSIFSLSSLSLTATDDMLDDAFFNFYHYYFKTEGRANGEQEGYFGGNPAKEYGNTIVRSLFKENNQQIETEAILVLNVWMAVAHELYETWRQCRLHNDVNASMIALDAAAALWIGSDQTFGSNEDGHSLYRLAEIAGERFGQDTGESRVNTLIVETLNSIQTNLSTGLDCTEESKSMIIRDEIFNILNLMTIPLVQNLIHHALTVDNTANMDFVYLYSAAVMPHISTCDPNLVNNLYPGSIGLMDGEQKRNWVGTLESAYSCFRLSCAHIGHHESGASPECFVRSIEISSFAGYVPSDPSAKALSFIDRDILQLEVLLQSRAYVAATDLYQHGYNSVYSLQDMALNQLIPNVPHSAFDLFESYYESNSYKFADSEIMKAMHSEQEFEGSSVDQISEIVVGLVKFEVIYLSLLSALKFSVQECWLKNGASEKYWDMGAAFFIGSIEGTPTGGMSGGQLLFGTSKKLCHSFGTCEDDQIQNAKVNTEILNALSNGKASILSEDCQSAQQYLDDAIISSLLVPLIQGALVYGAAVSDLDVDSADGSLGTAYAFSRGILPFVNQARAESSAIIDRNLRYPHRETSDISQVSEAFRLALPVMNVSCFKVGVLESAVAQNLCPEEHYSQPIKTSSKNITNPEPANIDDIAFGRYNFSSSETSLQFLSLALDIRDMIKAPTVNDAKAIYENGLNAIHTSYSRETTPITLRSFSTDAVSFMSQDPMFNIFKYALYDDKSFDNSDEAAFPYADEVVQEALLAGDAKLAAEAVVALNVWMMVAHKLYNVVRTCKNRGNAKMQVDEAVALWIGLEQSEANSSDGWLLYSLAQRAALDFGLDQAEAAVNTQLFLQFNELQSLSEQCFEDPAIHLELRIRVNEVIRSLSIPLLQHLLISIASDDQWHVELYSAGVISQSAACSPKVHSGLSNVLYTGFSQDRVNDEFFDNLAVFLRCMRVSCHDLHHSENADPKLQSLVSGICERLEGQTQQSQWLELEQARIDLDILQVGIFMRTKAYEAASDYYQNGLNSFAPHGLEAGVYKNATLLSLRGLATLPERVKIDEIDTFSQYYGSSTYADDIVMHCIQRTGIFHNASTSELAAIATRTLQTMVSFIAVLWQFELAIQICKKESDEVEATDFWNSGIAFFLGSIDGYAPEQPSSAGFLLHSLGMELCLKFGTCSDDGESNANEALFGYFEEAKHLLTDKKCDEVQNLLASDILPLLHVPTIQGVLFTSIPNNTMSNDVSSEGYVFSQSILPLLHEANAESGQAIANIFNSTLRHIMDSDDTEVVFQAIKDALPSMNIDCKQVGNAVARPDFPLCVEFHKLPQYAEHSANIGIDVAEMTKALLDNRKDLAQMIYTDGKNSYESRAKILQGVKTRSLQSLSTVASTDMLSEPLFNIFLYSYSNGKDGANFEESLAYADKFVQEMFRATTSESSKTLAAEAAVVLNVWMYFSHMLHEALESCKNNEQHEGNFTQTIDEAAAYWIGDAKIGMLKSSGHLLYGLADNMDGYFDHDETFSSVNDQVLALLAKAKRMLLQRNACAPDSDTLADLHATVNEIIAQAKVPLVQGLIHSLRTDDRDRVKLYSHALVPLIAVCNPTEYDFFQAELLKAEYDVANIDAVVERIYGVLPCLGLRCSEVGVHLSETFNKNIRSECTNPSPTIPVEGYPASDTFHEFARLDLDLREIDILMQMQAYEAANEIYVYGKHARSSLAELATRFGRELIPNFDLFTNYFDSNRYAHDLVQGALLRVDEKLKGSQRRIVVLGFSQTLIMEHAANEAMVQSVSSCKAKLNSSESIDMFESWDMAAGLLLGSIKRSGMENSDNWYAPYDLAQKHCLEFGTCTSNDQAEANAHVVELLDAGRGALLNSSCETLDRISEDIMTSLLIPRIQATLSASLKLSHSSRTLEDATEAYVFSRSILPLIQAADMSVATSIENTLALGGKHDKKTGMSLFSSLAMVYAELEVDCELVGETEEFDACYVSSSNTAESSSKIPLVIGAVCLVIGIVIIIGVTMYWLRKRKTIIPQTTNQPTSADEHTLNSITSGYGRRNTLMSPRASKILNKISSYGDDTPKSEFDEFEDELLSSDIEDIDDDATFTISNQKDLDII